MNAPDRWASYLLEDGQKRVDYVNDERIPNAGTFTVNKETHTVGNLLQMQLLRNKDVKFCGYQMPHPLEHSMHLKVQTTSKSKATPIGARRPASPDDRWSATRPPRTTRRPAPRRPAATRRRRPQVLATAVTDLTEEMETLDRSFRNSVEDKRREASAASAQESYSRPPM